MNYLLQANKWSLFLTQYGSLILTICVLTILGLPENYGWLILIGYLLLSWIGISAFYHRKISHGSFNTSKLIFYPGMLLGVLAGRGDPIGWALEHRRHHLYADTELDPHSGRHYSFKEISNPILMKYGDKINLYMVRDLLKDPFIKFINKYYNLILITMLGLCFILPILFYIWLIPMALTHIALNIFVYSSHRHGYTNYDLKDNSRNNWFISILFGGEGWENNHHYDEKNSMFKRNWYEFDPVGNFISLIRTKNV